MQFSIMVMNVMILYQTLSKIEFTSPYTEAIKYWESVETRFYFP